jgi:hypothetical protein
MRNRASQIVAAKTAAGGQPVLSIKFKSFYNNQLALTRHLVSSLAQILR